MVFSIGGANLFLQLLSLSTSVVLARALGPEARGELGYALLWSGLFANMGLLGVHIHVARQAAQFPGASQVAALRRRALVFLALLSSAVTALYFAALPQLAVHRSADTAALLSVAGLAIPFGMWFATQAQIELARAEVWTYNLTRGTFHLLYLLGVAAMAIAGASGALAYVWVYAAATALATVAAHVMVSRRLGGVPATDSPITLRKTLARSLPFGLTVVVSSAVLALDKIIVAHFFGAAELGYYLVASTVIALLAAVGEAVGKWMFARSAGMIGTDRDNAWLAQRLRQILLLYLIIGGLATIAAPLAVSVLYGAAFLPGAWIAAWLTPVAVMRELIRAFEETTLGLGMPSVLSRAGFVYLLVLILGALPLFVYPWLGLVVVAVWIASAAQLLAIAVDLSRRRSLPLREILSVRAADVNDLVRDVRAAIGK